MWRTKTDFFFTMATGLALLGILRALKIDSQLAVIKNDCYERLAIGQRHNSKDIFKTSHVKTVLECQLLCTQEKQLCRSFSFGIGVKGNSSCELSHDTIKETADLKPIGTKADTDYDLYIKKIGCTLVIDKNNPAFNQYNPQTKPQSTNSYDKPAHEKPVYEKPVYEKPLTSGYEPAPQQNKPIGSGGYGSFSTSYGKPQDDVQHVQTLVSISSGPQKLVMHPYQDILVGGEMYNYARPPFRPSALNHPYENRPNPDRYDSKPGESNSVSYGQRPIPDKYASYIPRPDHYGDYYRPRPDDYDRPNPGDYYRPNNYYRPRPPSDDYGNRPRPPSDSYDSRPRPPPSDDYNTRPRPPSDDYNNRPRPPSDGYDSRPRPPPGNYNHRPTRPNNDYDRPNPPDDYNRPIRPSRPSDYDRPKPPVSDYNNRPSDYDRPKPPTSDYNNRPSDYARPKPPIGDYNNRPSDYDRPKPPPGDYNNRPSDYDRPKPPPGDYNNRPSDYDRPKPPAGDYNNRPTDYDRPKPPAGDYNNRPSDYGRPKPPPGDYNRPTDYDRPKPPTGDYSNRPKPPGGDYDRPNRPSSNYDRPNPPSIDYDRPNPPSDSYHKPSRPDGDYKQRPSSNKPIHEYLFNAEVDRYDSGSPEKPIKSGDGYQKPESGDSNNYDNSIKGSSKPKEPPHSKPIVTQSVGPHGEQITSIITELEEACFRRVLAGKRVARAFVKRALFCERVEDCQRECAEEKRFVCEGFNYRLDPTGRGKGECELLQIPLSHLDIGRDLYPDPDYDYYERDRNAASVNCKGGRYPDYGYDGGYHNRRHDTRPYDWWDGERNRYGNRRPRPDFGYDSRPSYGYDDGGYHGGNRRGDFAYHDSHHSDFSHNYHYEHYDHGPPPYDYKSYEPFLPPLRRPTYDEDRYHRKYYTDRERDKNYWGFDKPWGTYGGSYGTSYNPHDFDRRNYYLPPPSGGNKNWGQYGGSYGTGGGLNLQYHGYGHSQSFDFWGLNKYEEKFHNYGELPPPKRPLNGGSYLPELPYKPPPPHGGGSYLPERPPSGGSYLPELPYKPPPNGGGSYLPERPMKPPSGGGYLPDSDLRPPLGGGGGSYLPERRPPRPPLSLPKPNQDNDFYNNAILPAEPRYPYRYDFLKDECSLRTAAGFRITKGRVKKFSSVPNIYECERLCFKEKEFLCASYAYRYTISPNNPTENCYLSDRNYKELDFYTDLEPDRNFDVYTMNNMKKCEQPVIRGRDDSECFWRVRSAQRLDHKVVRDSLSVKSIVECQLECLRSVRFTCRAFSFRYGSLVIGGSVYNCLLTDWPYYEMDPRIHFVPEPGFEIYERGSFGHGCEPHHFGIRGKPWKNPGTRIDQLCYVGYGSPVRLLPQATRKELQVATEEECKAECSKLRENTLFQCMSLSYCTRSRKWEPNCKLSDILQRDLLPDVDFVPDPDSWLFAWDNYNPECRAIANEAVHNHIGHKEDRYDNGFDTAIGTWRVYSVSGWPCRRGTLCRENRAAGFWYCELEGGDANTWDYCCRPDHQCGFSEGFQYQWCYVGPSRTQWRKCSDRYYPYVHNLIDRFDRPPPSPHRPPPGNNNYLPERPPPYRPGIRPDRPPAPPTRPPPRPSLDEYEAQFETQFLDPPKPGGFGQPRHWPLSYLHKEMPPNSTDSESRLMTAAKGREGNRKYAAIQNLIDIIKSNDLENIQYQITNESNTKDDILFVKIPLPTNFTEESKKIGTSSTTTASIVSDPIDLNTESKNNTKRSQKSLPNEDGSSVPIYRRGFVTRTNLTNHRSRSSRTL